MKQKLDETDTGEEEDEEAGGSVALQRLPELRPGLRGLRHTGK